MLVYVESCMVTCCIALHGYCTRIEQTNAGHCWYPFAEPCPCVQTHAVCVLLQGIMLDIVVMLFSIVRAYFPAELRWSLILTSFDMFSWNICMGTIIYCVFWTLW